jgi:hypothetical protein
MTGRAAGWLLVLIAFSLGSGLAAQYTFAPQQFDDMAAQLTVAAANQTNEPGVGEVTLTLTVKGPPTLEVEEPRLGDAAAAWKEDRQTSTRVVQDQHAAWSQIIRLRQSKRGLEPLPDVSLRFRRGPSDTWQEAKWDDILRHLRDVPGPPAGEEQPSWLRRWGFALILTVVFLLVLWAWRTKYRRRPRAVQLPPDQLALRELERLEKSLRPHADGETYHTQLSFIVRRYLRDRFGFHALQQTTAEFLAALRQEPSAPVALLDKTDAPPLLTDAQQALVSELFQRCDLAKFARASASAEECLRTTELARELVRQTNNP